MKRFEFDGMSNTKRVNQYKCQGCGQSIFTYDRDEGVTPMFLQCRASQGCIGTMMSAMYPKDGWFPLTPVKWEWYKPDKMPKDAAARDYVERGGLLLRELPESIAMEDLPDVS